MDYDSAKMVSFSLSCFSGFLPSVSRTVLLGNGVKENSVRGFLPLFVLLLLYLSHFNNHFYFL